MDNTRVGPFQLKRGFRPEPDSCASGQSMETGTRELKLIQVTAASILQPCSSVAIACINYEAEFLINHRHYHSSHAPPYFHDRKAAAGAAGMKTNTAILECIGECCKCHWIQNRTPDWQQKSTHVFIRTELYSGYDGP